MKTSLAISVADGHGCGERFDCVQMMEDLSKADDWFRKAKTAGFVLLLLLGPGAPLSAVNSAELKFYDSEGSKLPPSVTEDETDQSLTFPPEDYSPYQPSWQIQPYGALPNAQAPIPQPRYAPLPVQPAYPALAPAAPMPWMPIVPGWGGGAFPFAAPVSPVMPFGYPIFPWY